MSFDYGMGLTNIDVDNGIRYGAISANTIGSVWWDEAEAEYPDPACPECGSVFDTDVDELYSEDGGDPVCPECGSSFNEEFAYAEDPSGWYYKSDEYLMVYSELLNCVFVEKSPYYTFASYCSPCAPGAGDLDSPDADGIWAYCPGPDWFDGEPPFPIYRVSDNQLEKGDSE